MTARSMELWRLRIYLYYANYFHCLVIHLYIDLEWYRPLCHPRKYYLLAWKFNGDKDMEVWWRLQRVTFLLSEQESHERYDRESLGEIVDAAVRYWSPLLVLWSMAIILTPRARYCCRGMAWHGRHGPCTWTVATVVFSSEAIRVQP